MAVDDQGIVVGIAIYPGISTLQGPELDAEEFYDWLTSPTGGDVPSNRVDKMVSSAFQPAIPALPVSLPAQEVAQAFDRLHAQAFATGIPKRLGRRLYVYVAGHGAALPFTADPDQSDAAFLVADATLFNATHVMTKVRALYFVNAGIFDEIVVFMDCCRNYLNVTPNYPSYVNAVSIGNLGNERRTFFAFATKWGLNAREKPFNGVTRGIFTTALIAGLKGAAANPDGTITSTSLRNYLINHMKDLLTDKEQLDPDIPKRPDVPAPAVELVFATVPPQRVTVSVTFPPNAADQLIRLRGDGFKILASDQTPVGGPWVIPDPLPRGGYLVEIPALNLEKDFTLIGNERALNVVL
ncbi:MAG TPA: hypothetical protein VJ023_15225 [Pyrinomonadaceae bacterium]|nr:hypothetical protein [Pyrinomonadaceae bacterium]